MAILYHFSDKRVGVALGQFFPILHQVEMNKNIHTFNRGYKTAIGMDFLLGFRLIDDKIEVSKLRSPLNWKKEMAVPNGLGFMVPLNPKTECC